MQNALDIRRRINAISQTKKITSAMQLVASVRTRSVLQHIEYNHRYFDRVEQTMKEILLAVPDISHPFLVNKPSVHDTFIIISADKGMVGSYNSNVLKYAYKQIQLHPNHSIIVMGKVAEEFFMSKHMQPDIVFKGVSQGPVLYRARHAMQEIVDMYKMGLADHVYIIYTSFFGKDKTKPVMRRLLPIQIHDYDYISVYDNFSDVICNPTENELFDDLVPQYLIGIIFGAMVQAYASENFMRMTSMQSATKNADELLKKLHIEYNMARQAAITREITEITGASEILLKGTDK